MGFLFLRQAQVGVRLGQLGQPEPGLQNRWEQGRPAPSDLPLQARANSNPLSLALDYGMGAWG